MSGRERGGAMVELVIVSPLLLAMMLFVVGLGRLGTAREAVDGAARDAAREASIARTTTGAVAAAGDMARATLAEKSVSCPAPHVVTTFSPRAGHLTAGGTVTVRVECKVQNSDVMMSGLPGTATLHGIFTAVVDTYRGVQ